MNFIKCMESCMECKYWLVVWQLQKFARSVGCWTKWSASHFISKFKQTQLSVTSTSPQHSHICFFWLWLTWWCQRDRIIATNKLTNTLKSLPLCCINCQNLSKLSQLLSLHRIRFFRRAWPPIILQNKLRRDTRTLDSLHSQSPWVGQGAL